MKNFNMEGDTLPFVAPAGGVVSGNAYLIGTAFVVAVRDALAGAKFDGRRVGGFILPKAAGAVTDGAAVYWDNTAKNITATASGNTKVGFAYDGGALAGDATIKVMLPGLVA